MVLSKEFALDILGLPSFASTNDIILRYKVLALMWFPENHSNYDIAIQEFSNVTEAAVTLFYPDKVISEKLKLPEMYGFFQYIFFGDKASKEDDEDDEVLCGYETDECSAPSITCESCQIEMKEELKAEDVATELIKEEEREKAKAEKRRAKKKRRKEKKKLEKLGKETNTEKKESPKSKLRNEDPKSSESEEDIDTNSAFVSVIAKKHKVPGIESKYITNTSPLVINTIPKEDPRSVVLRSRQLALRGNEMASLGHYSEAIELFSESIKLDPSDHRFYGNRSYCYDRLMHFEKALKDAEKSIALCPVWPKGHFRKGRALLGLKKYASSEQCFVEVLKLDNDCEDAISELRKAKILQIMEKGYSKEHAEAAISAYGSVPEALNSLLVNGVHHLKLKNDMDIFISDDESDSIWMSVKKAKLSPHLYDVKRDPNNPEGHNSLWIGNVQADVTEKKLMSMFSKFGEIISVKVMPEKFCAFVNYKSKTSPGKAMQAYQGYELSGATLVIRFPNLPGETTVKKKPGIVQDPSKSKVQGPVNGNECYFWRTTGCVYGEQCRYHHIKEHKGVDKKKVAGHVVLI